MSGGKCQVVNIVVFRQVVNSTTLVIEDRLETAVHYTYSCRVRGRGNSKDDMILCSSSVNVGREYSLGRV